MPRALTGGEYNQAKQLSCTQPMHYMRLFTISLIYCWRHEFCVVAVQFQICIQNRYKLNKKLRKFTLLGNNEEVVESLEVKAIKAQAQVEMNYLIRKKYLSLENIQYLINWNKLHCILDIKVASFIMRHSNIQFLWV